MFDIRLRGYTPDGVRGRVISTTDIDTTDAESATAALTFSTTSRVAQRMEAPFVVGIEYTTGTTWSQPRNNLFVVLEDAEDAVDQTDVMTFRAQSYVGWLLSQAIHWWNTDSKDGRTRSYDMTPGRIVRQLIYEAQVSTAGLARGWAPMLTTNFSDTHDSLGQAWKADDKIQMDVDLWRSYSSLFQAWIEQGHFEWWAEGTTLMLARLGTGADLSSSVVLGGPGFDSAPAKTDFKGTFSTIVLIPDKANATHAFNAGADKRFGALETSMSMAGVSDQATAVRLAQPVMNENRAKKLELSYDWTPAVRGPIPWLDFTVGDLVTARRKVGKLKQRVVGIQVSKREGVVSARAIVGSKLVGLQAKIAKRVGSVSQGGHIGGTGSGIPYNPGVKRPDPIAPTGLVVTSEAYFDSTGTAYASVTATCSTVTTDVLGGTVKIKWYELWAKKNSSGESWTRLATTTDEPPSMTYTGLLAGESWSFKVRAYVDEGVVSAYSTVFSLVLAKDTTPPPVPAPPTGTSRLGQVLITHNGQTATGEAQPIDMSHFNVWMATTATGNGAKVGEVQGDDTFVAPEQPYNQPRWFWVTAQDKAGNKSGPSTRISVTTKPLVDTDMIGRIIDGVNIKLGTVKADLIENGAILTEKLADNAVSIGKLDTLTRDAINGASADAASANGRVTTSLSAPTVANGAGKPTGALWFRYNAAGTLLATWRWNGTAWEGQSWGQDAIAAGAIVNSKLADLAITGVKIADNAIEAGKIAANAVTAREIVAGTITAASGILANASVGTAQIADASITNAKIGNIDAGKITSGFIDVGRLQAGSILTSKLSIGNFANLIDDPGYLRPLGEAWIPNSASVSNVSVVSTTGAPGMALRFVASSSSTSVRVDNANRFSVIPGEEYNLSCRIQNTGTDTNFSIQLFFVDNDGAYLAVRTATVAPTSWADFTYTYTVPTGAAQAYFVMQLPGSATAGNVWVSKVLLSKRVTSELLVDGAIVSRTLATDAVTSDKIFARAITTSKIAADAVTANEIAALTIVAGNIAANAITAAKIAALQIEAGHLKANAVTADKIEAGAITTVKLAALAITSEKIAANAITASELTANAITSKHTITGAKFQTTATANRGIEITSAGLSAYNSAGQKTIDISASTGDATITGTIRNRTSGPRVQINSSDTRGNVWFHTGTAGSTPASITSDPDGEGLMIFGGALSGGVRRASLQLYEQGANSVAGWYLGQMPANGSSVEAMGYINYTTNTNLGITRNSGHYITLASTGTTHMTGVGVQVNGNLVVTGAKNFAMAHPTLEGMSLLHASTESPHNGVEYWSDGFIAIPESGEIEVILEDYFEPLTAPDHRIVILSAGSADAGLWSSPVSDGRFTIHGAPGAFVAWLVKARRIQMRDGEDLLAFDIVRPTETVEASPGL